MDEIVGQDIKLLYPVMELRKGINNQGVTEESRLAEDWNQLKFTYWCDRRNCL